MHTLLPVAPHPNPSASLDRAPRVYFFSQWPSRLGFALHFLHTYRKCQQGLAEFVRGGRCE